MARNIIWARNELPITTDVMGGQKDIIWAGNRLPLTTYVIQGDGRQRHLMGKERLSS